MHACMTVQLTVFEIMTKSEDGKNPYKPASELLSQFPYLLDVLAKCRMGASLDRKYVRCANTMHLKVQNFLISGMNFFY